MPPRPFLAPVAAGMGEDVARAIGAEVAAALRGGSGSNGAGDATPGVIQASATMPGAGAALLGLGVAALGWALSRPSSPPSLPGPTRAPPLMNQPSPDGDEDGSPEKGADPVKPAFKPNDAHNPRNNNHNPNKDPEPPDSEEEYKDAQRDPNPDKEVWYGKNAKGEWCQYREDNTGTAHHAGTVKRERVPITIRRSRK